MQGESFWRKTLANEVVNICKTENVREADCSKLVKSWVSEINPEVRPTITGVLITATRTIWGLTPHN